MTNQKEKELFRFLFFSQLQGKPVYNPDGKIVGRVYDFVARSGEKYPPITAMIFSAGWIAPALFICPWENIEMTAANEFHITQKQLLIFSHRKAENEIFLRKEVLDQQIIDTHGGKVVRVNDLHLLSAEGQLRLAHADIGMRGIVRRMGWESWIDALVRVLNPKSKYLKQDHFITWKVVQLLTLSAPKGGDEAIRPHRLQLNVDQKQLAKLHPADLAEILEDLDYRERAALFSTLDAETASDALAEIDPSLQPALLESVDKEKALDIVESMPPDEAADLLNTLSEEQSREILNKMDKQDAQELSQLLEYEPDSAGGMMTTQVTTLNQDMTVDQVLQYLRKNVPSATSIYYLYVVDNDKKLIGVLTLRHLVVADPQTPISQIMISNPIAVKLEDHAEKIADLNEKYNLLAVPVVDDQNRIQGVITVDDVLDHVVTSAWKSKIIRKLT
ncbi:MAG: magnesium transporter MgtE N-terminal domain-containing protein [bacterium]